MTLHEFEVWSKTSHVFRHVRMVEAEKGEFAGLSYFTCDCPAGRTSFRPGKPCKHIRQKAEELGVEIPASGHFPAPASLRAAMTA